MSDAPIGYLSFPAPKGLVFKNTEDFDRAYKDGQVAVFFRSAQPIGRKDWACFAIHSDGSMVSVPTDSMSII